MLKSDFFSLVWSNRYFLKVSVVFNLFWKKLLIENQFICVDSGLNSTMFIHIQLKMWKALVTQLDLAPFSHYFYQQKKKNWKSRKSLWVYVLTVWLEENMCLILYCIQFHYFDRINYLVEWPRHSECKYWCFFGHVMSYIQVILSRYYVQTCTKYNMFLFIFYEPLISLKLDNKVIFLFLSKIHGVTLIGYFKYTLGHIRYDDACL